MKSLRYLALVGIIITTTATGQEYDYERCASIGRSTGEFKEYMWCLDRLDARDKGKKYWRTPTPNDPTYKHRVSARLAEEEKKRIAEEPKRREEWREDRARHREEEARRWQMDPRRYASDVSKGRESYEKSRIAFAQLINNGGAGHWSDDVRLNTWWYGGNMVANYQEWEQAVNEERDFREEQGLDNPQYERNIRNLNKAKHTYSNLLEKAIDQAEAEGYDAPEGIIEIISEREES